MNPARGFCFIVQCAICNYTIPGALLITLSGFRALTSLKTLNMPKILLFFPTMAVTEVSTREMITRVPSILFQLSEK